MYSKLKMNTLDETVIKNIELLLNLKKDDVVVASKYGLQRQTDFIQVDNTVEIESAIYFTFSQIFLHLRDNKFGNLVNTIKEIEKMIDNIYENKQLNDLMDVEDKNFEEIMELIDHYYDYNVKERLFYQSPFFYIIQKADDYYHKLINIFKENNEYISKIMGIYNVNDYTLSFTSSDDDDEDNGNDTVDEDEDEDEDKDKVD